MASRPGSSSGSNRHRSREPPDDFPPLSAPRLPPLRNIHAPRDRDLASPATTGPPPSRRFWSTASRRAERIHSLDEQSLSLEDLDHAVHQTWLGLSHRNPRSRAVDHQRPNFEELDQTLDEANTQLRSLLDMTNHINLMTPYIRTTFSPTLRPHDFPDDNRRSKRRKLDADRLVPSFKGFRYGKYGQVEPGQLHMEIVSCDGGLFSNEESYAADNILKNDNSVYCTKGSRCNIVLRHRGATVFTLRELVIKAPGSMNYSDPVREGMVFIAMDQDDVLSRTAQYQIQHSLERDSRRIISIRRHDDGSTSSRARRSYVLRGDDEDSEHRTPQMPQEFSHNLPDLRVTTECSDDEDDDYDVSQVFRRAPNRIGSLPFEHPDSDSDDANPFGSDDFLDGSLRRPRHHQHQHQHQHPHRDRAERLSLSLAEAWDAHANATQEAVRAVGGELLAPHARFFIEEKKSKCTIRFDPPVSGRFILLKMWGSQQKPASNIDIQSVIARGFAGPRYFPSVELS
ncbi:eukaryotic translation initiation factor 6 [Hirsutella rhossiliensis]|uniref:Eukaryotic translation initiation factor 6 n=1 Tax=Hirsutella rhossiliensis TaxID=111463 RepID=A0A9P8MPQ1_9HYPO|nr:eukaryotic translation initiation factor 6 [Hirsutella rhossiliensis]KAH0959162.1 eukaryotic translation initiation factor 6 [Hirsutella rhossiliensis]